MEEILFYIQIRKIHFMTYCIQSSQIGHISLDRPLYHGHRLFSGAARLDVNSVPFCEYCIR